MAELFRQDQLRVDTIQMALSDNAADKQKAKKRAAKSTTTLMQHGPVVDVNVGSASSISSVRDDDIVSICIIVVIRLILAQSRMAKWWPNHFR